MDDRVIEYIRWAGFSPDWG